MSDAQKCDALEASYQLLARAFPTREHGRQLFERWGACEEVIHHVIAISNHYEAIHELGLDIQTHEWATLMADVTW